MRTVLTSFSVLLLALCVGCPGTPPAVPSFPGDPTPHIVNEAETNEAEPPVPITEESGDEPVAPAESAVEARTARPSPAVAADSASVPHPPLDALTQQIDLYVEALGTALERLDGSRNYAEDAANVVRDASGLALVALAVGLANDDSQYKKAAPHIITAAKTLVAAQNLEEGQSAFAGLKSALGNTSEAPALSWSDKIVGLKPAKSAIQSLNSAVKRTTDTERKLNTLLTRQPQRVYPPLAALAVLSQGMIPNVGETEKPDAVAEWKKYCEDFRNAALKVNAAAHQYAAAESGDYSVYSAAMTAMAESCDDCHRTFYPSAVGQE